MPLPLLPAPSPLLLPLPPPSLTSPLLLLLLLLLLHRLATLLQHAVLAARTLIAHSCPESDRAALLGRIGASYGLGFALGPAVGGLLSSYSLTATAWAAAAGSLLAMVVVRVGLPQGATGMGGGGGVLGAWAGGVLFRREREVGRGSHACLVRHSVNGGSRTHTHTHL
jgi:hypothetical protein